MTALGEWLMWAAGGVAAVLAPILGVVKRNRARSLENTRRLEGDPEDDNYPGLMEIAYNNNQKLDNLEARMEREHREVMSKLETMSDGDDP